MADHYYTKKPSSASNPAQIQVELGGRTLRFWTDTGVFSKNELDPGSRLLIENIPDLSGTVVDLGCGWGPIGISLALKNPDARLVLADVNERAVDLAQKNARENGANNLTVVLSDGFENLPTSVDCVTTNPPIRAGKQVIYAMFDEAFKRLTPGGALYIVIRKQQGAPSAKKHLEERFESVEVVDRSGGYWILRAIKAQEGEQAND